MNGVRRQARDEFERRSSSAARFGVVFGKNAFGFAQARVAGIFTSGLGIEGYGGNRPGSVARVPLRQTRQMKSS
jgi:hypothetical protein